MFLRYFLYYLLIVCIINDLFISAKKTTKSPKSRVNSKTTTKTTKKPKTTTTAKPKTKKGLNKIWVYYRFLISVCTEPEICHLKPDGGLCRAHFDKYYFDPENNKCDTFVYGGCKGNQNNFETEEECLEFCDELINKE